MKFIIDRAGFLKILQRVQGIVEKRNTMPILSNVCIEAKDKKVTVIATDLEVFIKDTAPSNVSQEGAVTINARKLFEIVKEMPEENVDVSANKDSKVSVKSGKARFNVMGLSAKDFPAFPASDESAFKAVGQEALKEMIDKTSFAASMDETRYNINGFLLEKDAAKMRLVTTDGHRLALIEKSGTAPITMEGKTGISVLLPRKGMLEFRRLLEEETRDGFLLGITQKNAVMKKDGTIINIRLLEGEFPDYKKVIPAGNKNRALAKRTELLSSLKRVSILSTDKIKGVKFRFLPNKLELSSSSPDIGDAEEEIDVEYNGEEIEMAFNAKYMMDMMDAVDDEKISIELKDAGTPGVMRSANSEDYTYVIMPMRL